MEASNYYVHVQQQQQKYRLPRSLKIREVRDFQFYDHQFKRNQETNVNSDTSLNSENANNLISYEHLGESWLELVLPFTILGITILGVLLVAVILFLWIRRYFSDEREKCQVTTRKKCSERKMNSRKWLLKGRQLPQHKPVDSQVVSDLEQKLEKIEFKNSPPTSPNSQKQEEAEEDVAEPESEVESLTEEDATAMAILSCPLAISCPQPETSETLPTTQIPNPPSSSPLSFLKGEVFCVQPREDPNAKSFKSIATSPPPFQSHKYATIGTQTYFTKAPNSPNNHLLSSSFAVLQTPTTSTVPSGNPFATSQDNKENKEPAKLRNSCLNKTISNFKQDNGGGATTTTSSSPSSPSSVISTSPKLNVNVLQQQNSPVPPGGGDVKQQLFNFSPKNTNSPSISSANYKYGNYFRFPDVGTPPVPPPDKSSSSSSLNKTSDESTDNAVTRFQSLSMESDRDSIILKIDEVESPAVVELRSPPSAFNNNNNNNLTIRRARLKSISLDSDGARLVEENLTLPVEELVEIASYNNKEISDTDSFSANINNNNRFNPKNIYNLTLNLDFRDSSLDITDINMNQDTDFDETADAICRTPTMKHFRNNKKAVSLDSDNQQICEKGGSHSKTASAEIFNQYFGQSCSSKLNSSISVPSTPKHLTSNKLKISSSEDRGGGHCRRNPPTQQVYKTNLTASIQTLNVSSSNLKTLPEISSISDFDGNQSPKAGPRAVAPSKSGILQRRGSNQSLTLNLDGSCGNLARGLSCSNYSLGNIHGSHLNIAGGQGHRGVQVKKNLLQRRGSNTSLTLNVKDSSSNNLNRFNSHSSLNIVGSKGGQKGGLLERRNSNASLTLNIHNRGLSISNCNLRGSECSLSSVNTNQMTELMMMEQEEQQATQKEQESCSHQRKFLSSENLHNFSVHSRSGHGGNHRQQSHQTPYGSIDNLKQSQPYHENIPVICTKPLSPQSTSEDFKIYLANIQFLQSASSVLDVDHLKTLNALFQKSYKTQPKVGAGCQQQQFNNDDILNNRISNGPAITCTVTASPDEEQKERLIKLHQEFWNLPTNYQEKPMVFGSQPKNRYKTILPNEHSRVILQKEDDSQHEPYINANFIKGPDYSTDTYIATQGPMNNTIYEFWLMILQNIQKVNGQGLQKIAMLTDFIESSRQKCAVYFPPEMDDVVIFTSSNISSDEEMVKERMDSILNPEVPANLNEPSMTTFSFFVVKNVGLKQKNGYSIRKLRMHYGSSTSETIYMHDVYHYWFPDWPDHRSPQDIDVLLDMSLDLLDTNCQRDFDDASRGDDKKPSKNPLPILHCSAGIGRTGCLAAILNGLGQIRANSEVDVLGIVCNLRLQRGGMVQNSEQYELIHRSLCLYQHKISQTE